jgi:hypothetical protein
VNSLGSGSLKTVVDRQEILPTTINLG